MFFCINSEYGEIYEGKTLKEAFNKFSKSSGNYYGEGDVWFIEGEKIKVEFQVVPATQVTPVKKTTTRTTKKG